MKALQRPARVAALVGAVAAVGAATVITVGTASAAEPAKCVENVNVREQPRIDSRVVALCEAGTTVEAGEIRNGFVRLNDLGGWAAQEYISINGQKPVKPSSTTRNLDEETAGTTRTGRSTAPEGGDTPASSRSGRNDQLSEDEAGTTDGSSTTAEDGVPGDRSESRTNGTKDAKEDAAADQQSQAKPQAKPASPLLPGGLLPGS